MRCVKKVGSRIVKITLTIIICGVLLCILNEILSENKRQSIDATVPNQTEMNNTDRFNDAQGNLQNKSVAPVSDLEQNRTMTQEEARIEFSEHLYINGVHPPIEPSLENGEMSKEELLEIYETRLTCFFGDSVKFQYTPILKKRNYYNLPYYKKAYFCGITIKGRLERYNIEVSPKERTIIAMYCERTIDEKYSEESVIIKDKECAKSNILELTAKLQRCLFPNEPFQITNCYEKQIEGKNINTNISDGEKKFWYVTGVFEDNDEIEVFIDGRTMVIAKLTRQKFIQ